MLLITGQSNAANFLAGGVRYEPSRAVVNFNVYDGKCYQTKEPLLGAGGTQGSFASRLGDLVVEQHIADRVILVPVALGSTHAGQWSSTLFPRIATALDDLRTMDLTPDAILWQQGEAEAMTPGYPAETYREHLRALVSRVRAAGSTAPFYVSVSTTCQDAAKRNAVPIRAVQRSIGDPLLSIRTGPDTDKFGMDYRSDGCHFNARGADSVAEAWLRTLWPDQRLAETSRRSVHGVDVVKHEVVAEHGN